MRIYGPNGTGTGPAPAARPPRPAAAGGAFAVASEAESPSAAAPATLRTVGGIEALLALQGEEGPAERRRRAVERGRGALDALDALKVSLLGGSLDRASLARLRAAAAELKLGSGDARLDAVLGEIELRVEVELAKFSAAGARESGRT